MNPAAAMRSSGHPPINPEAGCGKASHASAPGGRKAPAPAPAPAAAAAQGRPPAVTPPVARAPAAAAAASADCTAGAGTGAGPTLGSVLAPDVPYGVHCKAAAAAPQGAPNGGGSAFDRSPTVGRRAGAVIDGQPSAAPSGGAGAGSRGGGSPVVFGDGSVAAAAKAAAAAAAAIAAARRPQRPAPAPAPAPSGPATMPAAPLSPPSSPSGQRTPGARSVAPEVAAPGTPAGVKQPASSPAAVGPVATAAVHSNGAAAGTAASGCTDKAAAAAAAAAVAAAAAAAAHARSQLSPSVGPRRVAGGPAECAANTSTRVGAGGGSGGGGGGGASDGHIDGDGGAARDVEHTTPCAAAAAGAAAATCECGAQWAAGDAPATPSYKTACRLSYGGRPGLVRSISAPVAETSPEAVPGGADEGPVAADATKYGTNTTAVAAGPPALPSPTQRAKAPVPSSAAPCRDPRDAVPARTARRVSDAEANASANVDAGGVEVEADGEAGDDPGCPSRLRQQNPTSRDASPVTEGNPYGMQYSMQYSPRGQASPTAAAVAAKNGAGAGGEATSLPALLAEWHLGGRAAGVAQQQPRLASEQQQPRLASEQQQPRLASEQQQPQPSQPPLRRAARRVTWNEPSGGELGAAGSATLTAAAAATAGLGAGPAAAAAAAAAAGVGGGSGGIAAAAFSRGPKNRSSRYKGVSLYRRTGRYEAHIWHEGRQLHIGTYGTDLEAALAYDRVSRYLRGPSAVLNFPTESAVAAATAAAAAAAAAAAGIDAAGGMGGCGGGRAAGGGAAAAGGLGPRTASTDADKSKLLMEIRRLAANPGTWRNEPAPGSRSADDDGEDGGEGSGSGGGFAFRGAASGDPAAGPACGSGSRGGASRGGGGIGRGITALPKPWPSFLSRPDGGIGVGVADGVGGVGADEGGHRGLRRCSDDGTGGASAAAAAAAATAAMRCVRRRVSAMDPPTAPLVQLPPSTLWRAASSHELREMAMTSPQRRSGCTNTDRPPLHLLAEAVLSGQTAGGGGGGTLAAAAAAIQGMDPEAETALPRASSWVHGKASNTAVGAVIDTCGGGGGGGGAVPGGEAAGMVDAVGSGAGGAEGTGQYGDPPRQAAAGGGLPRLLSAPLDRNRSDGSSSYSCSHECSGYGIFASGPAGIKAAAGADLMGVIKDSVGGVGVGGGDCAAAGEDAWAVVRVGGAPAMVLPGGVLDLAAPLLALPLVAQTAPAAAAAAAPPLPAAGATATAGHGDPHPGRSTAAAVPSLPLLPALTSLPATSLSVGPAADEPRQPPDTSGGGRGGGCGGGLTANARTSPSAAAGGPRGGGTEDGGAGGTPDATCPVMAPDGLQQCEAPGPGPGPSGGIAWVPGGQTGDRVEATRSVGSAALQALLSAGVPPGVLRAVLAQAAAAASGAGDVHAVQSPPPTTTTTATAAATAAAAAQPPLPRPRACVDCDAPTERPRQERHPASSLPQRQQQLLLLLGATGASEGGEAGPTEATPVARPHGGEPPPAQMAVTRGWHGQPAGASETAAVGGQGCQPSWSVGVTKGFAGLHPPPPPPPPQQQPQPPPFGVSVVPPAQQLPWPPGHPAYGQHRATAAGAAPKDAAVATILRHLIRPGPQPPMCPQPPRTPVAALEPTASQPPAAAAATSVAASVDSFGAVIGAGVALAARPDVAAATVAGGGLPTMLPYGRLAAVPPAPAAAGPIAPRLQSAAIAAALPLSEQNSAAAAASPASPAAATPEAAAAAEAGGGDGGDGGDGSEGRLYWVGGQLHGLGGRKGGLLGLLQAPPPVTPAAIRNLLLSHHQQYTAGSKADGEGGEGGEQAADRAPPPPPPLPTVDGANDGGTTSSRIPSGTSRSCTNSSGGDGGGGSGGGDGSDDDQSKGACAGDGGEGPCRAAAAAVVKAEVVAVAAPPDDAVRREGAVQAPAAVCSSVELAADAAEVTAAPHSPRLRAGLGGGGGGGGEVVGAPVVTKSHRAPVACTTVADLASSRQAGGDGADAAAAAGGGDAANGKTSACVVPRSLTAPSPSTSISYKLLFAPAPSTASKRPREGSIDSLDSFRGGGGGGSGGDDPMRIDGGADAVGCASWPWRSRREHAERLGINGASGGGDGGSGGGRCGGSKAVGGAADGGAHDGTRHRAACGGGERGGVRPAGGAGLGVALRAHPDKKTRLLYGGSTLGCS